jgi:hypothetical protein
MVFLVAILIVVFAGNSLGLGLASLNLTNIQEKDRGWYNCKVRLSPWDGTASS